MNKKVDSQTISNLDANLTDKAVKNQKDTLLFRDRSRLRSYSNAGASLGGATPNVKNIKSNEVFVQLQQLLKTADILCIQEHWLFNFKLDLLNSISNTQSC